METDMTLEETFNTSPLAKAVRDARLGHVFLPEQDAVLIHDTEYTQEPKSEEQKEEMRDWVRDILTKVLGGLEREVKVFVDRDAGAGGRKCCCTSATYVVAKGEIPR